MESTFIVGQPSRQVHLKAQSMTVLPIRSQSLIKTENSVSSNEVVVQDSSPLAAQIDKRADCVLRQVEDKLSEAVQRKEWEVVQGFHKVIIHMKEEMAQLREQLREESSQANKDSAVQQLRKHLEYFRDQSQDLHTNLKKREAQVRKLSELVSEKDFEIQRLMEALRRAKRKEFSNLQQQSQSTITNHLPLSPLVKRLPGASLKRQPEGGGGGVTQDTLQPTARSMTNTIEKTEEQLHQHYCSSSLQELRSILESGKLKDHPQQQQASEKSLLKQFSSILSEEPPPSWCSPQEFRLLQWNSNQLQFQKRLAASLQKQLMKLRQSVSEYQAKATFDSELKQLFIEAVEESKAAVESLRGKKTTTSTSSPPHQPIERIDVFERFLSSRKFLTIIQAKIFNEKCCFNSDCLFNADGKTLVINHPVESFLPLDNVYNEETLPTARKNIRLIMATSINKRNLRGQDKSDSPKKATGGQSYWSRNNCSEIFEQLTDGVQPNKKPTGLSNKNKAVSFSQKKQVVVQRKQQHGLNYSFDKLTAEFTEFSQQRQARVVSLSNHDNKHEKQQQQQQQQQQHSTVEDKNIYETPLTHRQKKLLQQAREKREDCESEATEGGSSKLSKTTRRSKQQQHLSQIRDLSQ